MNDSKTIGTRCEIADLYFWLGADAERFGFTPWATAWIEKIDTTRSGESNRKHPKIRGPKCSKCLDYGVYYEVERNLIDGMKLKPINCCRILPQWNHPIL